MGDGPSGIAVRTPDGSTYYLSKGTRIQNPQVFAGYGTKKPLHDGVAEWLTNKYGGKEETWQHAKGTGFVDVDGKDEKVEIHWFQNEGVGRVRLYIKRWVE